MKKLYTFAFMLVAATMFVGCGGGGPMNDEPLTEAEDATELNEEEMEAEEALNE